MKIALGAGSVSSCPEADTNADSEVTVDEVLQGVNAALNGCPQ
jgi:hypothetical protein